MMTNEQYHADKTRIGKSGLDLINESPAKFYYRNLDPKAKPRKITRAFTDGSAGHSITLEREKFDSEFIVAPIFKGTGSQFRKETFAYANQDKTIIPVDTMEMIQGVRESVRNHPVASALLSDGIAEQTFTWIDPQTGVKCKCRPDYWNEKKKFIIDLKTTDDASPKGFARSAFKYRYHVQSPFYFDGLTANGLQPKQFVFIAVEKSPPYLVNIFYYPSNEMDHGREIYHQDLETYKQCIESGIWPGYSEEIKPLEIPGFY